MLTSIQIEQYHEQGFLALEGAIATEEIQKLRSAASDIVDHFDIDAHRTVFSTGDRDRGRDLYFMESAEAVHCFLEEGALDADGRLLKPRHLAINKIGHAMHDLVPAFTHFCRLPLFGAALRDLGYAAPTLWQTMYIFKQPQIGGEVRWHQDASYLVTTPPSVTGIWIALEDASRENGCLWMQPGGHRSPLREIYEVDPVTRVGELRTLDTTPWPSAEDALALEVSVGSVVFFHDHMPHYSSQNRSERSRHALTLHVSEAGTRWSPKNWLQRPTLAPFLL
jgi:phytanoyl-CoA hydroxylase